MTSPDTLREDRLVDVFATLVLVLAAGRLVTGFAAGILEWAHGAPVGFSDERLHLGDSLATFGQGGDSVGVVLPIVAALLVWWRARRIDAGAATFSYVEMVFGLTAAAACAQGIGNGIIVSGGPVTWWRFIVVVGTPLTCLVVAVAGLVTTRRLAFAVDARVGNEAAVDAIVYAVDRATGDVRAYFSADEAARKTHVYSVEDEEYLFYTDEGVVLDASVENDRVVLRPTDDRREADLLGRLKMFTTRRGIRVDVLDVDDPSAYAIPISDWQWLQLWPGWLRWMGRLFRPR